MNVYRSALKSVGEIWEGAALELVDKKDVPARPRAHSWIPHYPADPESILRRIRDCNPHLHTEDWKVGRLDEVEDSRRHAVFILNTLSLPHLNKSLGRVKYGFIKIQMKIYKSDMPKDSETADPTSLSEDEMVRVADETDSAPVDETSENTTMAKDEHIASELESTKAVLIGWLPTNMPESVETAEEDLLDSSVEEANVTVIENHDGSKIPPDKPTSL